MRAVVDVWFSPWQGAFLGAAALSLAAAAMVVLRAPTAPRLTLLLIVFVPNAVYHGLTQVTQNLRYAATSRCRC